jgi:hypothetical protein
MVKLRLSIILVLILFPLVLYVAGLHYLEQYAGRRIQAELERVYLGDVARLLDGEHPLKAAIQQNVQRYLDHSTWKAMGCRITVTVKTRQNTLLYPLFGTDDPSPEGQDPPTMEIAIINYRLINETPEVVTTLDIPQNSLLTLTVLGFCILLSFGGISFYYFQWYRHHNAYAQHQAEEQNRLKSLGEQYRSQTTTLEQEHALMTDELKQLRSTLMLEKDKTNANEEEMLAEIIALEEKISEKTKRYEKQQQELAQLQIKLEQVEKAPYKKQADNAKPAEMARKRLNTLYKNIHIQDRAVAGYLNLTEELKIKCEEVLHQLNDDPSKVQIKRKVFGKKNRATVLEVVFGYKGRLYYCLQPNRMVEVPVIGTKNSQQSDLVYLDRL